jgi:hypothetical protein
MTESILITGVINAKERCNVMTADIPNAFVQSNIDDKNQLKGNRIIMKIPGPLVDMLCEIAPEIYEPSVVFEGRDKKVKVL